MPGRRAPGAAASGGFTLIEVAAALAIAAGALLVLLQVLGDGGRGADRAAVGRLALLTAESALAGAGVEGPLAPGARWGGVTPEGLAWGVEVSDWPGAGRAGPAPLLVVASVGTAEGAVLARLVTIRLAPPPTVVEEAPRRGR